MTTLHLNQDRALAIARRAAVKRAIRTVDVGHAVAVAETPERTGKGRRSWHKVVVDDQDQQVYGDSTDGNDHAVPHYTALGDSVTGYVASNEGADDGVWYLTLVNDGVMGRTGKHMQEAAKAAMDGVK